jgi:hypothetical protein
MHIRRCCGWLNNSTLGLWFLAYIRTRSQGHLVPGMELHEIYVCPDEIFGFPGSRDHNLSYVTFELPLCSSLNLTLSCEDVSIPGEWYAECSLSYKINACAYICVIQVWVQQSWSFVAIWQSGLFILGLGAGESECPQNFADIWPLSYLFLQSYNDDTNVGRMGQKPIPHICASSILRHYLDWWFCNHGHLSTKSKMSVFISITLAYSPYFLC